jgi:ABC-type Na+ efflux pump permease subunit
MKKAILVALWEVRIYLQDKGDLAFSLLLPIVVFALMYGAFGSESLFHGTAHIVNEDEGGTYSTVILEQLEELDNLDVEMLSKSEADTKLDRSDLLTVLYIPKGFSESLNSGKPATQKLLDKERESPIVGVREETVGGGPDPVNLFLPGIITMFVLFSITLGAQAIVEERRKGTLERLLTTRLTVGQLFSGKFMAGISRGFVQTLILLVLSYIVFRHLFTPLTFIEVLVIVLFFAGAASAIGLVIASITRTQDQAAWVAVVFTMAMVMLGGTFFEIPEDSTLYTVSRFSLNTYVNDAFRTIIVEGGSLADVGRELVIMVGVIAAGLVLSRIFFKVMPGGR